MERAFLAHEVNSVEIEGDENRAEIAFTRNGTSGRELIRKISRFLAGREKPADGVSLTFPAVFPKSPKKIGPSSPLRFVHLRLDRQA